MQELIEKASTLMEALPYIRRFSGKTIVIKYGGHAMAEEKLRKSFAMDIILLKYIGINTVVVHGGGPQINETLKRYGIVSEFVRGMRVTDAETMGVVEMVLTGQVNREVVGYINQHGGRAAGVSGKDGNLLLCEKMLQEVKREDGGTEMVDIGFVGDVVEVNPALVLALEKGGFIPVIAPVGVGRDGQSYNINADLVAGKVAAALNAEKLILLTDVSGVKNKEGELLSSIPLADRHRRDDPEGHLLHRRACRRGEEGAHRRRPDRARHPPGNLHQRRDRDGDTKLEDVLRSAFNVQHGRSC